jgi:hypothetical protein
MELARGLLILKAKAPFSSPVAGSGKPFLPSLTLPANRDFFLSFNLFLTTESAKKAENVGEALNWVMGKDPVKFLIPFEKI